MTDNPFYDAFAAQYGQVPEHPGTDPATTWLPPLKRVEYGGHTDYPSGLVDDLVDVPPRTDDWCEDRPPSDLTDDDGVD